MCDCHWVADLAIRTSESRVVIRKEGADRSSLKGSWARECGRFSTGMGKVFAGAYVVMSIAVLVGALARASREDELLQKQFGEEWKLWAARVPWKLIPYIY